MSSLGSNLSSSKPCKKSESPLSLQSKMSEVDTITNINEDSNTSTEEDNDSTDCDYVSLGKISTVEASQKMMHNKQDSITPTGDQDKFNDNGITDNKDSIEQCLDKREKIEEDLEDQQNNNKGEVVPNKTDIDEKTNECKICHKSFKKKSNLKRHIKIHTKKYVGVLVREDIDCENIDFGEFLDDCNDNTKKSLTCDICQKTFIRYSNLEKHLEIHSCDKQFKCEVCHKLFISKSNLQEHYKIHSREKPYQCEVCERSFKLRGHLTDHMKIHTGEKNCICDVCGQAFRKNSTLKQHLRMHTGEKRFKCHLCEKLFTAKYNLKRHLIGHSGLKNFQCDKCGNKYVQDSSLKKHLRTHTRDKTYKCNEQEKPLSSDDLTQKILMHAAHTHMNMRYDAAFINKCW